MVNIGASKPVNKHSLESSIFLKFNGILRPKNKFEKHSSTFLTLPVLNVYHTFGYLFSVILSTCK